MINKFPTHAFFLLFRGKEVVLVRDEEGGSGDWSFPIGVLKNTPIPVEVEMILKDRYFREITVESLREIDLVELGGIETDGMFVDTPIYVCTISGKAVLGPVFFAKHNNTRDLSLSEKTQQILFSSFVQSRLH